MNNQDPPLNLNQPPPNPNLAPPNPYPPIGDLFFNHFQLTQIISISITIIHKIHFMQCIVHLFGPAALDQVMAAPHPVILPLLLYVHGFNVNIFIFL